MISRDEILTEICKSGMIEKFARSVDFKTDTQRMEYCAEMYLNLCELDAKKLQRLYKRGEVYFYLLKILRVQLFDKHSTYNRKYNNATAKRLGFELIYQPNIGIYKENSED